MFLVISIYLPIFLFLYIFISISILFQIVLNCHSEICLWDEFNILNLLPLEHFFSFCVCFFRLGKMEILVKIYKHSKNIYKLFVLFYFAVILRLRDRLKLLFVVEILGILLVICDNRKSSFYEVFL